MIYYHSLTSIQKEIHNNTGFSYKTHCIVMDTMYNSIYMSLVINSVENKYSLNNSTYQHQFL